MDHHIYSYALTAKDVIIIFIDAVEFLLDYWSVCAQAVQALRYVLSILICM